MSDRDLVLELMEKKKMKVLEKNLEAFQTLYMKTLGYDDKIRDQQRQIQKLDAEVAELKKLIAGQTANSPRRPPPPPQDTGGIGWKDNWP